jgi:hypothetical protein
LTVKDSAELTDVLQTWAVLLEKELFDKPTFEVQAGNLLPNEIAEGPRAFIRPEIWRRLSRITRSGLSDATKCLAAGADTAATMICFRVAEDIVRRYVKRKTGAAPRGWGEFLDRLKKTKSIPRSLIGHLDYLRDRRNEAEHPDRIFDHDEAERAFIAVIDLIHEMYPAK